MLAFDFSKNQTISLNGGFCLTVKKVPSPRQKQIYEDSNFGAFAFLLPGQDVPEDYVFVAENTYFVRSLSFRMALACVSGDLPEAEQKAQAEKKVEENLERVFAYYRGEWRYEAVEVVLSHPVLNRLFDGCMTPHRVTFGNFPSYSEEAYLKEASESAAYLVENYMARSKHEGPNQRVGDGNICLKNLEYAIRRLKEENGDADTIGRLEKDAQDMRDWLAV